MVNNNYYILSHFIFKKGWMIFIINLLFTILKIYFIYCGYIMIVSTITIITISKNKSILNKHYMSFFTINIIVGMAIALLYVIIYNIIKA